MTVKRCGLIGLYETSFREKRTGHSGCSFPSEFGIDELTDFDHCIKIDAMVHAQAVQQVNHIFGGNIASGPW
jgi:hypothetical protein